MYAFRRSPTVIITTMRPLCDESIGENGIGSLPLDS